MGITLDHDGTDLTESGHVWMTGGVSPARISLSPRIGISVGCEALWRFFDPASAFVSAHRRASDVLTASWSSDSLNERFAACGRT
jgi:3-methyladenine DNA glycosylase Mpg